MNRLTIIGNLGAAPEMRYTPTDKAVANFSVAVNERWNDSAGERREKTTWFRVTAWNGLAEVCQNYLDKGSRVLVEGSVSLDAWKGQDGQTRSDIAVNATQVVFLDHSNRDQAEEDDDLPW